MTRAFVLVTAIPPTIGHLRLIGFAAELADDVCVIVGSQPGEPYPFERVDAIRRATASMPGVRVEHLHKTLPQQPEDAPDFWPMWRGFLRGYGMRDGDLIVASERYGLTLAEISGGVFVPYDLERSITPVRATDIRADPIAHFAEILPEFQPVLRKRITVLGPSRPARRRCHGHSPRRYPATGCPSGRGRISRRSRRLRSRPSGCTSSGKPNARCSATA